ncbi:hypothetical protein V1512DRAFT_267307 [Lipomyces arxii]|uniref:uncharacterized protein n=1 Tax=Lipomyces arxii TaxID=56418 RepID=UPI0034CD1506
MCPDLDKIFLFGGFDFTSTEDLFNSVMLIDTKTFKATRIEDDGSGPTGRHGHTATYWKDGKLILFGGENERGEFLNELYIFDLQNQTWSSPKTYGRQPIGRARHAACMSDDGKRLYFCGGFRHHFVMSDIFCLDLQSMTWSDSRPFVARYDHVATVRFDKMWIFGGLTQDMDRPSEVSWFDLRTSAVATLRFEAVDRQADERPSRRGTPVPDKRAGTHFYSFCGSTVVDFMTHGPAIHNTETSITSFDLTELRWRTLADASCDIFSGNAWSYIALSGTTAYLLGYPLYSDHEQEADVLCRILPINLKYYGATPSQTDQSESIQPETLGADFAKLFHDREKSDFVVTAISDELESQPPDTSSSTADGVSEPIYVHTLILAARWPHFRRLSNSRMREYTRKRMHIPEPYSTVRALLYFLYSDTIAPDVPVDVIARLLVLSNMYALQRLRDLCLSRIQDMFDVTNAARIWECAKLAQEDVLRTSAARFCLNHWGRIVRTKSFFALSKHAMVELCGEIDLEGQVVIDLSRRNFTPSFIDRASTTQSDVGSEDMAMVEDAESDDDGEE